MCIVSCETAAVHPELMERDLIKSVGSLNEQVVGQPGLGVAVCLNTTDFCKVVSFTALPDV